MPTSKFPIQSGIDRRAALIGLGGAAAAACSPKGPEVVDADREFLVVEGPHPTKREPASAGKFYGLMGVAETLVAADVRGRPRPALASAWTGSDDRLKWRFTLRPGARFQDGTPVTAAAVVRALERALARPGVLGLIPISAIAAEGEEVAVRLRSPSVLALPALAHESTVILAPSAFDAADEVTAVIGTGPYKVKAATEQEVAVESWDGWAGAKPRIRRARYLSASRPETRALLAESGQADAVFDLDWPSESRLRGRPELSVMDVPSPRTTVLKVNSGHPFLADVRARRALSLAVDRQGIAKGIFGNADRAATQLLPAFFPDWRVEGLEPLKTDQAEARRLLAELGWRPGPDGVLVRDGRPFRLKLLSYATRTDQPMITAALQQQFRQVGVAVEVVLGSAADIIAAHKNGTLELAMFARNHAFLADPVGVLMQDYARGGGDWGAMGWEDEGVVRALQALASGTEPERAPALRETVVRTLQAELPVIPLIFNTRSAAFNRRVADVRLDPLERTYALAEMGWSG